MGRTKTKSAEEHRAEELAAHHAVNARNDYKHLAEVGRQFGFGMTIHTAATEWANLRLGGKPLGAKWVATWLRSCADIIEHDEGRRPSYMEEHSNGWHPNGVGEMVVKLDRVLDPATKVLRSVPRADAALSKRPTGDGHTKEGA